MIRALTIAAITVMTGCIAVPIPIPIPAGGAQPVALTRLAATPPASAQFDRLLTQFRAQNGMPPLVSNAGLDRVAAGHAADQVAGDYIAHRDRAGRNATGRVRAAGVSQCQAGENLARGQRDVDAVFAAWLASPEHRANMLRASYANYGFARQGDVWVLVMLLPC